MGKTFLKALYLSPHNGSEKNITGNTVVEKNSQAFPLYVLIVFCVPAHL